MAAPMHDIGKISVPDSVQQKPGQLMPEEFEIIRPHGVGQAFDRLPAEVLLGICPHGEAIHTQMQ